MRDQPSNHAALKNIAIACGGTGGHLFPGLAVGRELLRRGCAVTLLVSPKEVDQQAIQSITGMETLTLPAVGLSRIGILGFLRGFQQSYRLARRHFAQNAPAIVLAMGGFTSAPPILAGRRCGAKTFLHESNSIPGRANRWLARWVDGAFVYFPAAQARLAAARVEVVGMPVRPQFLEPITAEAARVGLGLDASAPVLLIMGGSQGAGRINELMLQAAPRLRAALPSLQFVHLTGARDLEAVRASYQERNFPAKVHAFWGEMGLALAAADVAVSRAGASSLAELAARQLPAVLIPYPTAADNHQYYNGLAFAQSGAAQLLPQSALKPDQLAAAILELFVNQTKRAAAQRALADWHSPTAAADLADQILSWSTAGVRAAVATRFKPQKMGSLHV